MAKKRKIRSKGMNKFVNTLLMIAGLLALVGVGSLFIDGTFLNAVILNWLPEVVHTITGWILIGSAVVSGGMALFNQFK